MPRIDPLQLLDCLKVLLTPNGGILSITEVERLAGLMTKFSKKLVSKCIYVLILKNTDTVLLNAFMDAGGWNLIQVWLQDATTSRNWPLVIELLDLLIVTPVDVARLKSYNIPRMVKSLSKRDDLETIHILSNQLVQQWLKIVKDETNNDSNNQKQAVQSGEPMVVCNDSEVVVLEQTSSDSNNLPSEEALQENGDKMEVEPEEKTIAEDIKMDVQNVQDVKPKSEERKEKEGEKKSHEKSRQKSSSSSKSSSRDKDRSSSHKSKDRRSSTSSSSKDKDRSKDRDKKDKHRSNGSVKSSSRSSSSSSSKHKDKRSDKEKQAEKDKDTLAKIQPASLQKLPKIPKKSSEDKEKPVTDERKGSMSIEVRKNNEERPKTVKVYKSQMRLTGLEEEAKPAPPRPIKKVTAVAVIPPLPITPTVIPPVYGLKRSSPTKDTVAGLPPEKKTKLDSPIERPGAIKLIPPKPKPPIYQESDMFMDALTASATTKKEPKKRKRRASISKDSSGTSPPSSPTNSIKSMAPKFYQDTLETEENKTEVKTNTEDPLDSTMEESESAADTDAVGSTDFEEQDSEPRVKNINGLKGALVYSKRKGPKKSIKWRSDDELVDIRYFELDETERVNVTKTFGDMAKMDLRGERDALQMARKLTNEDVMDVQTVWKIPMEIETPEPLAIPGCRSLEKDIQFAREKSVLQALYFNKRMIPDSPAEPDIENYQIKDPVIIPIEDPDNPDHDFRNTPWPEPKGSPPPPNIINSANPLFPNIQTPFPNLNIGQPAAVFNNMNMVNNMPPFNTPNQFLPTNMGPGDWNNVNVPNIQNGPMMHQNIAPDMMNQQGPMNPYMQNSNQMMNDGNHRFPPPFNTQGPGMFPPNNFNMNRGGFRRGGGGGGGVGGNGGGGGNGPWLRMNGPPPGNWNNSRGGGGSHRGGRLCNNIRNKGFCRNRDNCPFFHPNK